MSKEDLKNESSTMDKIHYKSLTDFAKSNKFPLLITLIFFLIISYVSFFHHNVFFEDDGILYLQAGETILSGNGKNLWLPDSPEGGPILFASLDSFVHDGFLVMKIISLLSGTSIVFVSYFAIKNIFNHKIALLSQLFVAVNPRLDLLSVEALNELLPVLLVLISLYFITKKELKLSDVIITGSLLGAAFMFRYQALFVLIPIAIFLLIRSKKIRSNVLYAIILVTFFVIVSSPILVYNYSNFGKPIDLNPNFYLSATPKYSDSEWESHLHDQVVTGNQNLQIFNNPNLFLKNYFYNLFYNEPSILFNFINFNNISLTLPIPFVGMIPVLGGLIYCLKVKLNRKNVVVLTVTTIATTSLVFLIGNVGVNFFAIIIIPLLVIGILNIKNIERNFLPLLVIAVGFVIITSTVHLSRAYHLFPMWIATVTLSALFFVEVIPKIFSKVRKIISISDSQSAHSIKIIQLFLIVLILLVSIISSYAISFFTLYAHVYQGIKNELLLLFQRPESLQETNLEYKQVGILLSKQPGIENSYVMSFGKIFVYYAHSKHLYTQFDEGTKNETLNQFITRENWSPYEIFNSDRISHPPDRNGIYHPIPDYLVYTKQLPLYFNDEQRNVIRTDNFSFLMDPGNPKIPTNFKLLYKSENVVVYKIDHKKPNLA